MEHEGSVSARITYELRNEELYALYFSPNVMQVIKARRLRWAGHVAPMGERRGAYRVLVGNETTRKVQA